MLKLLFKEALIFYVLLLSLLYYSLFLSSGFNPIYLRLFLKDSGIKFLLNEGDTEDIGLFLFLVMFDRDSLNLLMIMFKRLEVRRDLRIRLLEEVTT